MAPRSARAVVLGGVVALMGAGALAYLSFLQTTDWEGIEISSTVVFDETYQ
jgi:hypothetical protein